MRPNRIYAPVLIMAFFLVSETPRCHGLYSLTQLAVQGIRGLATGAVAGIDFLLSEPTPSPPPDIMRSPHILLHSYTKTIKKSDRIDNDIKTKGDKSGNNKKERGENESGIGDSGSREGLSSVETNSSTTTTDKSKRRSNSKKRNARGNRQMRSFVCTKRGIRIAPMQKWSNVDFEAEY